MAKPLEAAADTIKAAAAVAANGAAPGSSSSAAANVTTGVMVAEWGRRQLMVLLSRVMIRSCKADLALLPPCYKKVGGGGGGGGATCHTHSYTQPKMVHALLVFVP